MMQKYGRCGCVHHYMAPVLVVLIALVVLLGNLDMLSAHVVGIAWPILLGLFGLQKMMNRCCRCCGGCDCGSDCKCGCCSTKEG